MSSNSASSFVALNVGGQSFVTSVETLRKDPQSMLAKMFSNSFQASSKDEQNRILVDPDPGCFTVILNFLRTGRLFLPKSVSVEMLYEEAQYFCIDSLLELLSEDNRSDLNRNQFLKLLQNPSPRFRGIRLSFMDLTELALQDLDFSFGKFNHSRLPRSQLSSSVFVSATAEGADFTGKSLWRH